MADKVYVLIRSLGSYDAESTMVAWAGHDLDMGKQALQEDYTILQGGSMEWNWSQLQTWQDGIEVKSIGINFDGTLYQDNQPVEEWE